MLDRILLAASFLSLSSFTVFAEEPTLPATAVKATQDQFIEFINGKTVDAVIYDAGKSLTAILKWDWKKKRITGDFIFDGTQKGKVKAKWSFDGDKACSQSGTDPKTCHDVYLDGGSFIEMRDDGKIHAISIIKS